MTDLFDLTGKNAIVTGASSGIGEHFAFTLAGAGANVVLAARRVERCRETAAKIESQGKRALALALDVRDAHSVAATLSTAESKLGPIAILVNNAGVAVTKPLLEYEEKDWDYVVDTNLKGAWLVAQETARRMVRAGKGGSIINIASLLAFRVAKQLAAYSSAKAGLVHLTRAMAVELAPHGIRVNAIAPGYIETDMNRAFFHTEAGQKMLKRLPQRRLGKPSELDGALLLLASEASSYINGSVITIDGGHSVSSL